MILALDSYYKDNICNTSLVIFDNVKSDTPLYTDTIYTDVTSDYIPGEFYKRELPGIIKILDKLKNEHYKYWIQTEAIILDSYIILKSDDKEWSGLGQHLIDDYLNGEYKIIIGVAKTKFGDCDKISETIYRGNSKTPLYIQASNKCEKLASLVIAKMHGQYRIPTMLKLVDQLSRIFPDTKKGNS